MNTISRSLAIVLFAALLATSGPAHGFFAETAVQTHQGDHTSNPTGPYSGNGVFTSNPGNGVNATSESQDFIDDLELGGLPLREEHARGDASLTTTQVKAKISGTVRQAGVPGGGITLALGAIGDGASLSRPGGPPFGQRSGDVVTFSLKISGSLLENVAVAGTTFNPSIVALIFAQPGTLTSSLLYESPDYLCRFYWGLGADAQVNYSNGGPVLQLPFVSRLTSFPVTLTGSCPTGAAFDWAVYIRPELATFGVADWSFDFGSTVDVSVSVPDGVVFTSTGSGVVPPPGTAPVTDHYLSYKTKATKGSVCAADAAADVGAVCQAEEDCGGVSTGTDATDFCVPNTFVSTHVTLTDALEPASRLYAVTKPLTLYTPADKNDEGVHDSATHLRSYAIALPKLCAADAPAQPGQACKKESDCGATTKGTKFCQAQAATVKHPGLSVTNQFGVAQLDAVKPDRLLVPTSKGLSAPLPAPEGSNVDHYTCYTAAVTKGSPKFAPIRGVSVADQFTQAQFPSGKKLFDLTKPTHLCMPANKNGEGVLNPLGSLACYKAVGAKGQPKHRPVKGLFLANQLDVEQADATAEEELCVPSDVQAAVPG